MALTTETSFPIVLTIRGFGQPSSTHAFREVVAPKGTYNRLESTEGLVPVLYSPGFGAGWYTSFDPENAPEEVIFDSRLVQFVASEEFRRLFNSQQYHLREGDKNKQVFHEMMTNWFGLTGVYAGGFSQLKIQLIPKNVQFRIEEYDGAESVEIFNPARYFVA
jgi:hypothetical protein